MFWQGLIKWQWGGLTGWLAWLGGDYVTWTDMSWLPTVGHWNLPGTYLT